MQFLVATTSAIRYQHFTGFNHPARHIEHHFCAAHLLSFAKNVTTSFVTGVVANSALTALPGPAGNSHDADGWRASGAACGVRPLIFNTPARLSRCFSDRWHRRSFRLMSSAPSTALADGVFTSGQSNQPPGGSLASRNPQAVPAHRTYRTPAAFAGVDAHRSPRQYPAVRSSGGGVYDFIFIVDNRHFQR